MKTPLLLLASSAFALGQALPPASAVIEETSSPDPLTAPAAKLGYSYSGNSDLDWHQFSFNAPITPSFDLGGDFVIGALIDYKVTDFVDFEEQLDDAFEDLGGTGDFGVDDTFHTLALPIYLAWNPGNSKWSALFQASPQLTSDLEEIDEDDFKTTAFLAVQYKYADWLSFHIGYGSSFARGQKAFSPFAGFTYTPCDEVAVTLRGTALTGSYRATDKLIIRAGGYASGGVWNIDPLGESVDLGLSTFNVGAGIDYRLTDKIWLSIWAGATVANEFNLFETNDDDDFASVEFDNGFFGYIGIKAFEW